MKKICTMYTAGILASFLCVQMHAADLSCITTAAELDLLFGTSGTIIIPGIADGYITAGVYHAATDSVIGVGRGNDPFAGAMLVAAAAATGSPASGVDLGYGNIALYALTELTTGTLVAAGENSLVINISPAGQVYAQAPATFANNARYNTVLIAPNSRIMAGGTSNNFYPAIALYSADLSTVISYTEVTIGEGGDLYALTLAEDGTIIGTGDGYAGSDYFIPFIKYNANGAVISVTSYAPSAFAADATYAALSSAVPFDAHHILTVGQIDANGGPLVPVVVKVSNDLQTVQTVTVISQLELGNNGNAPVQMKKDSEGYFVLQSYLATGETAFTRLTPTGAFDYSFAQNCIATQTIAATFGDVISYQPGAFVIHPEASIYSLGQNGFGSNREPVVIKLFAPLAPPTPSGCTSSDPLTCAVQKKYFAVA